MRRTVLVTAIAIALLGTGAAWAAPADKASQSSSSTAIPSQSGQFAMVLVNDKEVMRLAPTSGRSAENRAAEARKRLRMMLVPSKGSTFKPAQESEVSVVMVGSQPVVRFRSQNVADATKADAALNGTTQQGLAQRWASDLRSALSGLKVGKKGLPQNAVQVATGHMQMPRTAAGKSKGGGAGRGGAQPSASPS